MNNSMPSKSPVVSIVMCVKNTAKYLSTCIESIQSQTFRNYEFIIIDDHSTDKTVELIIKYANQDSRIVPIFNKSKGLPEGLNFGIQIARGKYLARMDGDDFCDPKRIEKQVDFLNKYPDYVAIGCQYYLVDPSGNILTVMGCHSSHEEIDKIHISGEGGALCGPAVMIRLDTLKTCGGYRNRIYLDNRWIPLSIGEDLDLFLRLAEFGKVANIPETLFYYRQSITSICHQHNIITRKMIHDTILTDCYRRRSITHGLPVSQNNEPITTLGDIYRKWGWWAFGSKQQKTSLKWALRALLYNPFKSKSWKLLLCIIRRFIEQSLHLSKERPLKQN